MGHIGVSLKAHSCATFEGIHDETRLYFRDVLDSSDLVDDKLLVLLHTRDSDFESKIEVAARIIALDHLIPLRNAITEVVDFILEYVISTDVAQDHEAAIDFISIDDSRILLDIAFAFQTAVTFESRSSTKVYSSSQFLVGKSAILLELLKNLDIDIIQCCCCHK